MKKNNIKNIAILLFVLLGLNACEKELDKLHIGESNAFFTIYDVDNLSAPANVYFTNGSKYAEAYEWIFEGGDVVVDGVPTGDDFYTDVEPDNVFFEVPGQYTAILKVTADGQTKEYTKDFEVKKPMPIILNTPIAIVFGEAITYYAEVFKYPGEEDKVTYSWDFGDGTDIVTEERPVHVYPLPGGFTITLTVNDGYETLVSTREIRVKAGSARSLYITDAKTGKLFRKMLYTDADDEPRVQLPTNIGVHPLGLAVVQDAANPNLNRIIITNAGENVSWSPGETLADGKIFSVDINGEDSKTILDADAINASDVPEYYYTHDPFSCTTDADGNIYWIDRYNGIRKLNYLEENAEYPADAFAQVLAADIGESTTFGWTDGCVKVVGSEIWYSKHASGKGLFKFSLADGSFISKINALYDYKIRAFDVDLVNLKIYFVINSSSGGLEPGFYVSDFDGLNVTLLEDFADYSTEGGGTEKILAPSVVVDIESGYVYFPFRHTDDINSTGDVIGEGDLSGIKRYKLDQSEDVKWYITGVIPYAIGMDITKR